MEQDGQTELPYAIVASLDQETDQSRWICSHHSGLVWVDFWFFVFNVTSLNHISYFKQSYVP